MTPQLRFEASRRIHDDFDNGKYYYALHGRLIAAPLAAAFRPDPAALAWHNDHRFKG